MFSPLFLDLDLSELELLEDRELPEEEEEEEEEERRLELKDKRWNLI